MYQHGVAILVIMRVTSLLENEVQVHVQSYLEHDKGYEQLIDCVSLYYWVVEIYQFLDWLKGEKLVVLRVC